MSRKEFTLFFFFFMELGSELQLSTGEAAMTVVSLTRIIQTSETKGVALTPRCLEPRGNLLSGNELSTSHCCVRLLLICSLMFLSVPLPSMHLLSLFHLLNIITTIFHL